MSQCLREPSFDVEWRRQTWHAVVHVRIPCHHRSFTTTILTNFVVEKSQQHNGWRAVVWVRRRLARRVFVSCHGNVTILLTAFDVKVVKSIHEKTMLYCWFEKCWLLTHWCFEDVGVNSTCHGQLSAWSTDDDLSDGIKMMQYDLQQALMLKWWCGHMQWLVVREVRRRRRGIAVQIIMWIRRWHAHSTYSSLPCWDDVVVNKAHSMWVAKSIVVLNYQCGSREDSGFGVHFHKVIAKGWDWKLATPYL